MFCSLFKDKYQYTHSPVPPYSLTKHTHDIHIFPHIHIDMFTGTQNNVEILPLKTIEFYFNYSCISL